MPCPSCNSLTIIPSVKINGMRLATCGDCGHTADSFIFLYKKEQDKILDMESKLYMRWHVKEERIAKRKGVKLP